MIKRLRKHFAENNPASAFSLGIWTMIYLVGAILLLVFGDSPAQDERRKAYEHVFVNQV